MRLDRIGSAAAPSPREEDGASAAVERRHLHETTRSSTSESNASALQRDQQEQQQQHQYHQSRRWKEEGDDADHHTIVDMSLRTVRYVVVLVLGLGFSIAYAVFSFKGMTLRSKVYDAEGTSSVADDLVSRYSSISGPIMFMISKILEFYCETLVFPTLQTYLHNCSFFPGDQPHRVESKAKKNALFWAFKIIFILINVGLTSLYVSQIAADIEYNIKLEDLYAAPLSASSSTSNKTSEATLGKPTAVTNTVLQSVVSGYVAPFEMKTDCGIASQDKDHPRINQVESTSISLGFPMNDWNIDLLPNGLVPVSSIEFTYGEYKNDPAKYNAQAASSDLDVMVAIETVVQGGILFEQSVTNMDFSLSYNCTLIPSDMEERRRRLQEANMTEEEVICYGVYSLVPNVTALQTPGRATFANLVVETVGLVTNAVPTKMDTDVKLGFQKFYVTDQIMLETITIDVPLEGDYELDKSEFDAANTSVPVHFLDADECGLNRCIFKSSNDRSFVRSEISLTPYVVECGEDMVLDDKLYGFYPTCSPMEDALMLYGLGSYITADSLELDSTKQKRKLVNPKAYMSISFGKLSWNYTALDKSFNANCADTNCQGVSMHLDDGERLLLVGEDFIPQNHINNSFARPLRLLSLNSVVVPLASTNEEFTWYPISNNNIGYVAPGVFGNTSRCDSLVDSYIEHIENNHFYVEKPLQTMYTSALLYLFQNGVQTELVKVDPKSNDENAPKRLNLDGALEVKKLSFSVSAMSAIATFIGCSVMCLLALAVVLVPTARVKQSPNTTAAAQYVQILTDDMYPDLIHKKRLRFDNGDALLMNEYVVDNIVLYAKRDPSKKIYL